MRRVPSATTPRSHRIRRPPVTARGSLRALLVLAALGALAAAPATKAAPAPAKRPAARAAKPAAPASAARPVDVARQARALEEQGDYAGALAALKRLRGLQGPDADLELAIALDEARTGQADSAWVRLHGPLLSAALADTVGLERRMDYPYQREGMWLNGRFDGWYWYIARARAELALARRDWKQAVAMANRAAAARPLSGREALLLAFAASHAGDSALGEAAAHWAAHLEPWLPEAHHLAGLWAWRSGRRAEAREYLETAAAIDSTWREPVLALARLSLPGTRADSLPVRFLNGPRGCALLTSARRPKQEEFTQFDRNAMLLFNPQPQPPDSLRRLMKLQKPTQLYVQVLVSETGHALLMDLPYVTEDRMPAAVVNQVLDQIGRWRFLPALRFQQPEKAWVSVEYVLQP